MKRDVSSRSAPARLSCSARRELAREELERGACLGLLLAGGVDAVLAEVDRASVATWNASEGRRGDLRELGDELEAGSAAVIVIGESKIEEQLEKAMTRANRLIEKQVDADADELEREIDAAARADAG
jgi:hypothetical protein